MSTNYGIPIFIIFSGLLLFPASWVCHVLSTLFSHIICALKSYWTIWYIVVHTKLLRPALSSSSGLIREVTTCHWNICVYLQARPVLYGCSIVQWKSSVRLGGSHSYSIPGQFCL